MKVGDLVMWLCEFHGASFGPPGDVGILIEWYDTPKGMVTVYWWGNGKHPTHVSKLKVISQS